MRRGGSLGGDGMATGFRRSGNSGGSRRARNEGPEDSLGGAFSQAQITQLMKSEFARARRHGEPLTCVLLKVDRLTALAETHGAALKATLRQEVGRIVDAQTRGHDYLGMMNDGSYLLVLPAAEAAAGMAVAERILAAFRELEIESDVGASLRPTLSGGIAACGSEDETMFFDTLVSQAELALETAAALDGDRIERFQREEFVHPGGVDAEPEPRGDAADPVDEALPSGLDVPPARRD